MDEANKIMTKLQKDDKLWQNCDFILDHAQNINTKFFALIILEENITVDIYILAEKVFLKSSHGCS